MAEEYRQPELQVRELTRSRNIGQHRGAGERQPDAQPSIRFSRVPMQLVKRAFGYKVIDQLSLIRGNHLRISPVS